MKIQLVRSFKWAWITVGRKRWSGEHHVRIGYFANRNHISTTILMLLWPAMAAGKTELQYRLTEALMPRRKSSPPLRELRASQWSPSAVNSFGHASRTIHRRQRITVVAYKIRNRKKLSHLVAIWYQRSHTDLKRTPAGKSRKQTRAASSLPEADFQYDSEAGTYLCPGRSIFKRKEITIRSGIFRGINVHPRSCLASILINQCTASKSGRCLKKASPSGRVGPKCERVTITSCPNKISILVSNLMERSFARATRYGSSGCVLAKTLAGSYSRNTLTSTIQNIMTLLSMVKSGVSRTGFALPSLKKPLLGLAIFVWWIIQNAIIKIWLRIIVPLCMRFVSPSLEKLWKSDLRQTGR